MNTSKYIKKIYLAAFLLSILIPNKTFSQGPNAPEAVSFEPVDATDMVNLLTGDFSYVVPLLNIPSPEGGYPIALSYHAGIAMDQEASWTGLGWSLNPGAINRKVNGHPDDWKSALKKELAYDIGGSEYTSSVSVGVGIAGAWSVGVGMSWGSNRSLGGSVSASVSGVYGSVGTEGVSAGLGINDQLGIGASVGYNGSVGINASVGLGKGSGAGLNIGVGYGPGGLNGSVSISQVTTGKGSRSSLGIGFSSNSINVSASINGVGTSQSLSTGAAYNSSDYDIDRNKSSFMIVTPWAYFSWGKNTVSWQLSTIKNISSHGALYSTDKSNVKNFAHQYLRADPLYDGVEINTEGGFELSNAANFTELNNGVLPNLDHYNVTAQGLGGSIAPTFTKNIGLLGNDGSYGDNGAPYNVNYAIYWDPLDDRKISFNFKDYKNSYLNVIPKKMEAHDGSEGLYHTQEAYVKFSSPSLPTTLPNDYLSDEGNSLVWHKESYSSAKNRRRKGRYIEYFTNEEINSGVAASKGFLDVAENFQRDVGGCGLYINDSYQKNNEPFKTSIGGYKITTSDGKTYHYSLPVYQAEEVRRIYGLSGVEKTEDMAHVDHMNLSPYATHWLLTAITGPDYVKIDVNRKFADEGDYGYWVRFDYGQWSGGHTWKTPNGKHSENVDLFEKVKEYRWGRKQIYYLDKIKTRTNSAIFIKSLRNDNKSVNMVYKSFIHHKVPSMKYVDVKPSPLLKLDKILLLKNKDANTLSKNSGTPLIEEKNYNYYITGSGTGHASLINPAWYQTDAYFVNYNVNQSNNVYDTNDILSTNIESKSLKVIQFNHDYSLVNGSPNSTSGKLTLKSIQTKGKMGVGALPKTNFGYVSYQNYDLNKKNDFGYYKDYPQAWSLNKITTPTGASININYEKDLYNKAAINKGKVFTSQLKFDFITTPPPGDAPTSAPQGVTRIKIEVDNLDPTATGLLLSDYFNPSQPFFMDMWYSAIFNHTGAGYDRSTVNINSQMATIIELNTAQNYMIVDVVASSPFFRDAFQHAAEPVSVLHAGGDYFGVENLNLPRFEVAWEPHQRWRKYSLRHTLIGNKLRINDGCGIRVKQIVIKKDGSSNSSYTTNYDYTNPITNEESGVIPYYPEPNYAVKQQAPYISLLPSPIVTYEYVTESNYEISKRYKFKVLEELNISNNLISFGDLLEIEYKKYGIPYAAGGTSVDIRSAKEIRIKNNLNSLGRIEEIKVFNAKNQMMSSQKNKYKIIDKEYQLGQVQQSFYAQRKRSTYLYPTDFYDASITSNKSIASILESTQVISGGYTQKTTYDKHDLLTDQVLETTTVASDGTKFKSKTIPAYTIPEYSGATGGYGMGSKVDNITNKNMLSQQAASYSYLYDTTSNTWKETGVGITTWNKDWVIENPTSGAVMDNKVWRKHKSYVWEGGLNDDGSLQGYQNNFDWTIVNPPQQPEWKKISETTKYNAYSMPLELRDINSNYVATRMGDHNTKIIATCNSKYSDMIYTGAEYPVVGNLLTLGNVIDIGTNAHTGTKIITANYEQEAINLQFYVKGGGDYKMSVWVHKDNAANVWLKMNTSGGAAYTLGEKVTAGNWVLLNYYLNFPSTGTYGIVFTSSGGEVKYDDFRIHPIAATMTSYVYNKWNELSYMLNTNNLGTHYEYDEAGRLIKTYTEVIDNSTVTGGFKKISENNYHYKSN